MRQPRYWWVNQNQTAAHEIGGGYLWSPKLGQGDIRLPAYENMKEIEPGDIIFSYAKKKISNYGLATSRAIPSQKPAEFGSTGSYWSANGWLVSVAWTSINPIERDIIGQRADSLFDELDSPFASNGSVKQAYLFEISKKAADFILMLSKVETEIYKDQVTALEPSFFAAEARLDDMVEKSLVQRTDLAETEKATLVQARRGQGLFKENLKKIEIGCRLTGVDDDRILVASHIKPWRYCESTFEKLDGHNGLLLTPTMDRLFDHRYMTFEDDGQVVLSKKIGNENYERIGLNPKKPPNVGRFSKEQATYLSYHRDSFLA